MNIVMVMLLAGAECECCNGASTKVLDVKIIMVLLLAGAECEYCNVLLLAGAGCEYCNFFATGRCWMW